MTSEDAGNSATDTSVHSTASGDWKRREMKGIPASMGALWTQRDESGFRYALQLDESHCNAQGFIHGGVLMTFMDHCLSLLVWERSGRALCSTIHLDSHFLTALRAPAFVELDAEILRQGRTLAFARGVLRADGKDIMEAKGVWSITAVDK